MDQPLLRLGILGSGKGSNFLAIHREILEGSLHAQITVVISDQANAPILEHARQCDLLAVALPPSRWKTKLEPEREQELASILKKHQVDLVVLAGYMRIVKAPLLKAFPNRIINIHPSLLPAFKGKEAWKQALEAGVRTTGCTVHYVNEEIDGGSIIAQREIPVFPHDTPEQLHARIQEAEHKLYPWVIQSLGMAFQDPS